MWWYENLSGAMAHVGPFASANEAIEEAKKDFAKNGYPGHPGYQVALVTMTDNRVVGFPIWEPAFDADWMRAALAQREREIADDPHH